MLGAIWGIVGLMHLLRTSQSFHQYAVPLVLAKPRTDGVYEFDLVIEHKMTMSITREFGFLDMVDYDIDDKQMKWHVRSSDLLESCTAFRHLNQSDDLDSLLQLHGMHQRVITINGESPGQPIVVPLGAEVIMRVHNRLMSESITIHVHGMDKRNLWYTDGVALLQQCPIPVMSSYAYRFIADTPGTLWYHGHFATDRGEGLLGAFIVTNENEVIKDSSREYVAMLQDWSVTSAADSWYLLIWDSTKWSYGIDGTQKCWTQTRTYDGSNVGGSNPIAALLVNDKGWYDQDDILTRPNELPLEIFRIKQGETIRLRIINGGMAQGLMVSIEKHAMTIVAADGAKVKPVKVDFVIIFPGERYDVLVESLIEPEFKTYYVVIETLEAFNWTWDSMAPVFGLAKLEYEDKTDTMNSDRQADLFHSNCNLTLPCMVMNCPFAQFPPKIPLKCLGADSLCSAELHDENLIMSDEGFDSDYQEHFINMHYDSHANGWMFHLPRAMPYYHYGNENAIADWCDPTKCGPDSDEDDKNCKCFYHLNITLGNIVQLTIYNMGLGGAVGTGYAHPIHIHGTHFHLMKVGYPSYDDNGMVNDSNADLPCRQNVNGHCNDLQWTNSEWSNGRVVGMNTFDPSFRDTVIVPIGGYIVIRFRAVNPGWFYAHCHIMVHHMSGMAFALRIGDHSDMPIPPDKFPHDCGIYEPPPLSQTTSFAMPTSRNTLLILLLPLLMAMRPI